MMLISFILGYILDLILLFWYFGLIRSSEPPHSKERTIAAKLQLASLVWPIALPVGLIFLFFYCLKGAWTDAFRKE